MLRTVHLVLWNLWLHIHCKILNSSLAFDLLCPKLGQWNKRANAFCFDWNKYICVLDATNHRYTETCDGPRIELPGYKTTINRNNFDAQPCSPERYQELRFTTVGNSDCIFKKSKCAEEGQIHAHLNKKESVLGETQCRCDYTKGYSFMKLPKNKCNCNPSEEDCSCFRKLCPQGKQLSSGYQCVTEIVMKNRLWDCPNIANSDENFSKNDDQVQQNIEKKEPTNGIHVCMNEYHHNRSNLLVRVGKCGRGEVTAIVLITVVLLIGLLIFLVTSEERIKCLAFILQVESVDSKNAFISIDVLNEKEHGDKYDPSRKTIYTAKDPNGYNYDEMTTFNRQAKSVESNNAIIRTEVVNEKVSENGHEDTHDESGKTIYPTECQNGNNRGSDEMTTFNRQSKSVESNDAIIRTEVVNEKVSENGHDDKHDESRKTIYPTEGQNGNNRGHDEMKISENEHDDTRDESRKTIYATEDQNGYNGGYCEMTRDADKYYESRKKIDTSESQDGYHEESDEMTTSDCIARSDASIDPTIIGKSEIFTELERSEKEHNDKIEESKKIVSTIEDHNGYEEESQEMKNRKVRKVKRRPSLRMSRMEIIKKSVGGKSMIKKI